MLFYTDPLFYLHHTHCTLKLGACVHTASQQFGQNALTQKSRDVEMIGEQLALTFSVLW